MKRYSVFSKETGEWWGDANSLAQAMLYHWVEVGADVGFSMYPEGERLDMTLQYVVTDIPRLTPYHSFYYNPKLPNNGEAIARDECLEQSYYHMKRLGRLLIDVKVNP